MTQQNGKVLPLATWPTADVARSTPSLTGRQVQILPADGRGHRVFVDGIEIRNVRAVRIDMEALDVPRVELELIGSSIAAQIKGATVSDVEPPPCAPDSSATE